MFRYINLSNIILLFILLLFLLFSIGVNHDFHYFLSPLLCLIPCVYLFFRLPIFYYSELTIVFFFFIPVVFLSSFNFFSFSNIEINYMQYLAYSLLIYIYPLAIYNFLFNRKDRIKYVIFLFYAFWVVSLFYFVWTYLRMQNRWLDQQAFNAFYYVLMPVPILLMWKNDKIRLIVLLLTFVVCVFSLKRSAIIAISLLMLIYLFDFFKRRNNNKFLYVCTLLLSIVGSSLLISSEIIDRFNLLMDRMKNISEDGGSGRLDIILRFVKQDFSHFDFMQYFLGKGFMATKNQYQILESLHNDWLEMFNSYGCMGVIFLLIFFVLLLKKTISLYRKNSAMYVPYFSLLVLFFLYSLLGGSFNFVFLSLPLFCAIPIGDAICQIK